jgi:hypothetical protein
MNICNCTICARKRGEIYVSGVISNANGEANVKPNIKPNIKPNAKSNAKPTKSKAKPNTKPKAEPNVIFKPPENPTKYWGTIYGPSGEKIGTAFAGEDDDNPNVVVPKLMTTYRSITRNPKRRRVFIGMVQDSWGLDDRTVREVVNKGMSRSSARKGKGKQKAERPNGPSSRMYIGRKPPLYTEQPQLSETSSNDEFCNRSRASSSADSRESSRAPLSPLSPDWPKPDVGESAHFGFVPNGLNLMAGHEHEPNSTAGHFSLTPNKISMAISAALGSLASSDQ